MVENGGRLTGHEHCPSCGKEMTSMQDYPLVRVFAVNILELPQEVRGRFTFTFGGQIDDITEEVKNTVARNDVQQYLKGLKELGDNFIDPKTTLPPFEKDQYFEYAYPVPQSITVLPYYLVLSDLEEYHMSLRGQREGGIVQVKLFSSGPNMGSAGGPTLVPVVDLADIQYVGNFLNQKESL